jgi:hypothetical protein
VPKRASDDLQRQEHAAWRLLEAVRELFPQKFNELEDLRGVYDAFEEEEKLDDHVRRWTKQNRISCDAVNKAAYEFADGRNGPTPITLALSTDKINLLAAVKGSVQISDSIKSKEGLSAIEADPLTETLEDFVARATTHYHRKRSFLERSGFTRIRRDFDHFRYLALHRVGGYTWEQITDGWNRVPGVTNRNLKTIAGEAAKIAKLLGLAPGKRGRPAQ